MEESVERLRQVREKIAAAAGETKRPVSLVAVSKTFDADDIRPLLLAGHRAFGENRVQEAQRKWPALEADFPGVELHLIGPLQSNKTAEAVALFDVIETVDRDKIAAGIAGEMRRQDKATRLYVQINTGMEAQKSGIAPPEAVAFVARCRQTHGVTVEGLMCIPPAQDNPGPHFALLEKLSLEAGLSCLSMGMSGDYELAVRFGATSVRVGSAIFGSR